MGQKLLHLILITALLLALCPQPTHANQSMPYIQSIQAAVPGSPAATPRSAAADPELAQTTTPTATIYFPLVRADSAAGRPR